METLARLIRWAFVKYLTLSWARLCMHLSRSQTSRALWLRRLLEWGMVLMFKCLWHAICGSTFVFVYLCWEGTTITWRPPRIDIWTIDCSRANWGWCDNVTDISLPTSQKTVFPHNDLRGSHCPRRGLIPKDRSSQQDGDPAGPLIQTNLSTTMLRVIADRTRQVLVPRLD